MHHVDQRFEQDEILRNGSQARANENTIELLLREAIQNDCLRGFAKINQAQFHVVAQAS